MKSLYSSIVGSVVAPIGFHASGVYCDIKRLGTGKGSNKGMKRDLAVIYSESSCVVAGQFTTNQIKAAPVILDLDRVATRKGRAVVVNSGNANACTGARGLKNAHDMATYTARQLGLTEDDVYVCSTGRIGVQLPMPQVRSGIRQATSILSRTASSATNAAEAILTSDSHTKEAAVEFTLDGQVCRIGAIAKGAGMIQPGMTATGKGPRGRALHATMLAFITTDVALSPSLLTKALDATTQQSFNCVTVDGDMSTNDTVLLLANGLARNETIKSAKSDSFRTFQTALDQVTLRLAKMMARDGEGVTKVVTLKVSGARNPKEADSAARAIGNSQLVKTSWCGEDPNWGRIMDALGYSKAQLNADTIDIGYRAIGSKSMKYALKQGKPTTTSLESLAKITKAPEFEIHIDLHIGDGQAILYASDLTEEYVDFNKGE